MNNTPTILNDTATASEVTDASGMSRTSRNMLATNANTHTTSSHNTPVWAYNVVGDVWLKTNTYDDAKVNTCKHGNCKTCNMLATNNWFTSCTTNKSFIICRPGLYSCASSYVVYLITCDMCKVQYVGATTQPLRSRMNGHRCSVGKGALNTNMCNHFNLDKHNFCNASLNIIDSVDRTCFINDASARNELWVKEKFWINVLSTIHPFGLNDNNGGNVAYFETTIRRRQRSHGARKNGRRKKSNNETFDLDFLFSLYEARNFNILKANLNQIGNEQIKNMVLSGDKSLYSDAFFSILHAFMHCKHSTTVHNNTDDNLQVIKMKYSHPCLDKLNVSSILNDTKLLRSLPDHDGLKNMKIRTSFSFADTISGRICNVGKFLKLLNMTELVDIMQKDCDCEKAFVYLPCKHVISGNLDIIQNEELRNLMAKGAKYREIHWTSWKNIQTQFKDALVELVGRISRKCKLHVCEFDSWMNVVLKVFDSRCRFLINNYTIAGNAVLNKPIVRQYLNHLQSRYVITTVDKASSNFVFVCRKYYLEVLLDELGFDRNTYMATGNITYSKFDGSLDGIIKDHVTVCKNVFNIAVSDDQQVIPQIYWIPKLHKSPYKARFIAGAFRSSTKQVSQVLNFALKLIRIKFKSYCGSIMNNSGFNYFWSICSSGEFLSKIGKMKINSLQVYDFSTLYTNLDLGYVEESLYGLIDLLFPVNTNGTTFMCVNPFRQFFSHKKYNNYTCLTKTQLKNMIHFVIQNTFVQFGGVIFKQYKGVPMGGCSSPLIADLFLGFCEFNFMKSLVADNRLKLAKLLSFTSRYVDDICIVNYKYFGDLLCKIYPSDLIAERSGKNNKEVDYLDLKVSVCDDMVCNKIYHKVDDFNFPVVLYTFPSSNMPVRIGYNVFASQVLRFARLTTKFCDFQDRWITLFNKFAERGYRHHMLKKTAHKVLLRHITYMQHFGPGGIVFMIGLL